MCMYIMYMCMYTFLPRSIYTLYIHVWTDNVYNMYMYICTFVHVCIYMYMHVYVANAPSSDSLQLSQTLLVQTWYPMTVCTNSRAQKEIIAQVLLTQPLVNIYTHGSLRYTYVYVQCTCTCTCMYMYSHYLRILTPRYNMCMTPHVCTCTCTCISCMHECSFQSNTSCTVSTESL